MNINENLEAIREKAADVAQSAVKKTKRLAEIAKANLSVYAEEDKVKKAYLELGKLYYRDYAVEEERDEGEYLQWCRRIDEAKQNIAELRDYIDGLKYGEIIEPEEAAAEAAVTEETPAE